MDDLIDTWAREWDFIMGIANLGEREGVVATVRGLNRKFTPRRGKGLGKFTGWFLV
jgi:hypothetical protein